MKVDRKKLKWFLSNIRITAKGKELTDSELIDELANWVETNPSCIDINGIPNKGRFSYHTVGYGVFSLLGERYRMGRVEIFDKEDDSGYATSEGSYCMPFVSANQFENFIESIQTDLPINISIGSHEWCVYECEKDLGIEKGMLNDMETKKAYYHKKNDEYAVENGYTDWDAYMADSIFAPKKKEDES